MNILRAPSKINICLKVNGKMEDGYHDLSMIMQSIALYDILEVQIEKYKKGKTFNKESQINLKCNFSYIPTDERNLIYKIVRYIYDRYSINDTIFINLKKMIPTSAGLGGGSSDAATILLFLNRYYNLFISMKELNRIANLFGSDIPFFLYKRTCLCKGRGEKITSLRSFKSYYLLIATPDVRVSTKDIYEAYDKLEINQENNIENDEKLKKVIFALERNDIEVLSLNLFNDLERITARDIPEVDIFKKKMIECGAVASLMSGSGPTVFGIFNSVIQAKRCKEIMKQQFESSFIFVAKPL